MGGDIALSTNKRKLYVLYFKRAYVQHWNYVLVWIAMCLRMCWHLRFLVGSCALFMRLASMKKYKSNFKIGFHDTIHTFKNYFAIAFSVFNNKQYPNKHYISVAFCIFLGSQGTVYGTTISAKHKFLNKFRSYNTIYTFKNYFFIIFSLINFQTHT